MTGDVTTSHTGHRRHRKKMWKPAEDAPKRLEVKKTYSRQGVPQPARRVLTDNQQLVLAHLDANPQGPTALASRTGLTRGQVTSSLYALQAKGLATKTPEGWVA